MTRMPDFLVIGAARAGTTALHRYLRQYPKVFMPNAKEPNFFAFEGMDLRVKGPGADYINNSTTDLASYQSLFADVPDNFVCGEASPLYLYSERAPNRIRHHIPNVKMVVILRNPFEQAMSHYLYALKQRIEPLDDFTQALKAEEQRLNMNWQPLFGYSRFPLYATQLERYFAVFPREQFLIRLYEDFVSDPEQLMSDIAEFIGVDTSFVPDMSQQHNAGGVPKSKLFQDFLMKPNPITKAIGLVVPQELRWKIRDRLSAINLGQGDKMTVSAHEILSARFLPEIERLEKLLDRNLSTWKS